MNGNANHNLLLPLFSEIYHFSGNRKEHFHYFEGQLNLYFGCPSVTIIDLSDLNESDQKKLLSWADDLDRLSHVLPLSFLSEQVIDILTPVDKHSYMVLLREGLPPLELSAIILLPACPPQTFQVIESLSIMLANKLENIRLKNRAEGMYKYFQLGKIAHHLLHEIKNKLITPSTFFQTCLQHDKMSSLKDNQKFFSLAHKEIQTILDRIHHYRQFCPPIDEKHKEKTFQQWIDDCLVFFQPEIQKQEIEIHIENLDQNFPIGKVLPTIRDILFNLLLNAIEACHPEDLKEKPKIKIGSINKEESFHFFIENTGKPIPAKDRQKLFNPYYTTRPMGTGLGLTIVKEYVDQARGEISISSGKTPYTTRFQIDIPKP